MPLAKLSGYAVAAIGLKWWDHTYARSDDGFAWGCFGRDSAGLLLASGTGDSSVADCLAKPIKLPGLYAGIRYGITGVCHQAANRVLYPAGITVAGAKGYGLTIGMWKVYGRGVWAQRDRCVEPISTQAIAPVEGDKPDMQEKDDPTSALSRKLISINQHAFGNSQTSEDEISRQELQALADTLLGIEYDQIKIAAVINLQLRLHREQDELVRQLDNQFLSRKQYLAKLNESLRHIYSECEKILGSADFQRLFGAPLDQVDHMVDPDVFLAVR